MISKKEDIIKLLNKNYKMIYFSLVKSFTSGILFNEKILSKISLFSLFTINF